MSWWKAVTVLVLLGGCAELGLPRVEPLGGGPVEAGALLASQQRAFDMAFAEAPFDRGPLAVVAAEGGELSTYGLVPCQSGAAVCGGSAHGPVGQQFRTAEYIVVEGLYGRRFWLGYGGDGYIERHGIYVPLAWNARPNGQGPGFAPVLETPFRHH